MIEEQEIDLRCYFAVLRRWLWLIALCMVLAAVSAYFVSSRMEPIYRAEVTMLVHQAPSSGTSDYAAILTSERQARTYAEMLNEEPVLTAVIEDLGLQMDWRALAGDVDVELVRDTQLVRLSVEDADPVRAAQVANGIADAFIAQNEALQQTRYADSLASVRTQMDDLSRLIEETQTQIDALTGEEGSGVQAELSRLETILAGYRNSYVSLLRSYEEMRLTAAQSADNVVIYRRARIPDIPVRPRTLMNTGLASMVGGMMAVGAVFLVEYLDDTLKSPDDVRRALNLSTVGVIGRVEKGQNELVTAAKPLSPVSEAYRVLRTNIRFAGVDKPLRKLVVTSAGPTEGKSMTVANLAVTMAQAGLKVVVVDADLRRPRQHKIFGIHPRGGLTDSLLERTLDGRLQASRVDRLAVLPAGEVPPNPAELLGSQRLQDLLERLMSHVDMVLIDSPPVLPVTDAAVLAQVTDGVLLVIDAGETRREVAERALGSLERVEANVIGVVLNRVEMGRGGYYRYYREYYGDNGHRGRRKKRRR